MEITKNIKVLDEVDILLTKEGLRFIGTRGMDILGRLTKSMSVELTISLKSIISFWSMPLKVFPRFL